MEDDDYELIHSPLEHHVTRGGITVAICIYRGEDETEWLLEVEGQDGSSTVWEDRFPTDEAALAEAMQAIETDGIASFGSLRK